MNTNTDINDIIEFFLKTHPAPTTEDWKALIAVHRENANEIADRAMSYLEIDEDDYPVNEDIVLAVTSRTLAKLYAAGNPNLERAEQKLELVKGPKARVLATQVGLDGYTPLFNDVLSGAVRAPARLLRKLSNYFEESIVTLQECFRLSFEQIELPSFKSPHEKPMMSTEPLPWRDAVLNLKASESETSKLLSFEDDSEL